MPERAVDKIVEFEDLHQHGNLVGFLTHHSIKAGRGAPPAIPSGELLKSVRARINQGRWIADCPTQGCGGALLVSVALPLFWCPYCGNAALGGEWLGVRFPGNKTEIESTLVKRPGWRERAVTRNWSPGETITALIRENNKQGII